MVVICNLVLELGRSPHKVIVTEPLRGTVLATSALRYEVDFTVDSRRIVYRDLTLDWAHFMVRRDQCVPLP